MDFSQVTTFCPGHISGYFLPMLHDDLACSGSIGAGLVISEGVRVSAMQSPQSSVKIFHTDRYGIPTFISESSPIIEELLTEMHVTATIETYCHLPMGSGYGMSAAALLGTVHALNILYRCNLSPEVCARIAHRIEVKHRSGLGDIAACQGGGFVVRRSPGPGGLIIRRMDDRPIYALTIRPLKTSLVLSSPECIDSVFRAFPVRIPTTLDEIMILSREFAEKSGLISDDIRPILAACDEEGVPASMTMLGCGVFALGSEAKAVLKQFGEVYTLRIAAGGPRVIHGERCS